MRMGFHKAQVGLAGCGMLPAGPFCMVGIGFDSGMGPVLTLGGGAYVGTILNVSLWDKGATSMDTMGSEGAMGMAMPGVRMDAATMGITADVVEVPAGEVTFLVINEFGEF